MDHARLSDLMGAWMADELGQCLPSMRCTFEATVCAHPQVPPPHLAALVYVAVPSLANLGLDVGHASILALGQVNEANVRNVTRQTAAHVQAVQQAELAAANGAPLLDPRPR